MTAPSRPFPWRPWLVAILVVGGWTLSRLQADRAAVMPASGPDHVAVSLSGTPKVMRETPIEVVVSDSQGRPVSGDRVVVRLTMPDMTMPENKAIARPITDRPGHYRATGVFTMGGDWEIEAIAAHDHRPASGRQRVTVRL